MDYVCSIASQPSYYNLDFKKKNDEDPRDFHSCVHFIDRSLELLQSLKLRIVDRNAVLFEALFDLLQQP